MTGDTHPTQPLPDPAAQWVLSTPERRPRRRWPWLVAVVTVIVLAVAAWFIGEQVARGIVEKTIREQVVSHLVLPADQQIDVELPGQVLPQLIAGRIDTLTLTGEDVPLGRGAAPLTGDVVVHATGIPVRGDDPVESAAATVTLDQQQVQALLGGVPDFPAEDIALDEPEIAVATTLRVFGVDVPVGVALTPSVSAGELVLTPTTLRLAGAEISAQALVDQFGAVARTVVRDWDVCVAQYLPAGLRLTDVRVESATVVAALDIDGAIIHDEALQRPGTCD